MTSFSLTQHYVTSTQEEGEAVLGQDVTKPDGGDGGEDEVEGLGQLPVEHQGEEEGAGRQEDEEYDDEK